MSVGSKSSTATAKQDARNDAFLSVNGQHIQLQPNDVQHVSTMPTASKSTVICDGTQPQEPNSLTNQSKDVPIQTSLQPPTAPQHTGNVTLPGNGRQEPSPNPVSSHTKGLLAGKIAGFRNGHGGPRLGVVLPLASGTHYIHRHPVTHVTSITPVNHQILACEKAGLARSHAHILPAHPRYTAIRPSLMVGQAATFTPQPGRKQLYFICTPFK